MLPAAPARQRRRPQPAAGLRGAGPAGAAADVRPGAALHRTERASAPLLLRGDSSAEHLRSAETLRACGQAAACQNNRSSMPPLQCGRLYIVLQDPLPGPNAFRHKGQVVRYPRRARATDGALPGGCHVPVCAQSTNIVFLSLRPCLSAASCAWQRFRQIRITCWLQLPTDSGTDESREACDMADMHNAALSTQMHSSVHAVSAMQRCLLHDRSVLTAHDGRISAAATTPAHCIGRQTRCVHRA